MKFTLRDLFWLVLLVGLALAWWMESRSLRRQLRELRETHEQMVRRAIISY